MNKWILYLRKSREDAEQEKNGELETLSKHRNFLFKFAKEKELNIVKIYEEIVSGESILHRPEMIKLLADIETKEYSGVLVMDMDRLGRGGMQDQGLILETFKQANAKIMTPRKCYDLSDEFDEEYSEFEAFMARKELKIINRRLRSGIERSVQSGNYNSARRPFGYNIISIKNGRTLEINQDEAEIIKLIYDMYANQNIYSQHIAEKLNSMGIKTALGNSWSAAGIIQLMKNPIYIGKITWKKHNIKKSKNAGQLYDKTTNHSPIVVDGKHPPIISEELFNAAMRVLEGKYKPPVGHHLTFANPLSGLIVCGVCGKTMVLRSYKCSGVESHIMCRSKCGNKSAKFSHIENRLLDSINEHLKANKMNLNKPKKEIMDFSKVKSFLEKELDKLKQQKLKLHDLLEQNVYDTETFLERQKDIIDRQEEIKKQIAEAEYIEKSSNTEKDNIKTLEQIENVLTAYRTTESLEVRNSMLKSILVKAVYLKNRKSREDSFTLSIYPRL